jgi:DNA-binding CsgD family transcriptional regulator
MACALRTDVPPELDRRPRPVELLSDRELQALGLLAAGKSYPEIAEELVVALDTVKKHVTHILDQLGAANRAQAVAHARALRYPAGGRPPPRSPVGPRQAVPEGFPPEVHLWVTPSASRQPYRASGGRGQDGGRRQTAHGVRRKPWQHPS